MTGGIFLAAVAAAIAFASSRRAYLAVGPVRKGKLYRQQLTMAAVFIGFLGMGQCVGGEDGGVPIEAAAWFTVWAFLGAAIGLAIAATRQNPNAATQQLFRAAEDGSPQGIRAALAAGASVDVREASPFFSYSPLDTAVQKGGRATVKELLRVGAKPTAHTIEIAVHCGDTELVHLLLQTDPTLAQSNLVGVAIRRDYPTIVELLATHNVNVQPEHLATAARTGKLEWVEHVFAKAPTIDPVIHGSPALAGAIHGKYWDIVERLLEFGVSVDPLASGRESPLVQAIEQDRSDLVKECLRRGAPVAVLNELGAPALVAAVRRRQGPIANLLLENGADINATDREGRTAVWGAAEGFNAEMVKWLVSRGADLNVLDRNGRTILGHTYFHAPALAEMRELVTSLGGVEVPIRKTS